MKLPFTGGCVCGEVRYECSSRPLMMLKCHCHDCQQVSGGAYTPVVVVPLKHFKLTKGALQHYATPILIGLQRHRRDIFVEPQTKNKSSPVPPSFHFGVASGAA